MCPAGLWWTFPSEGSFVGSLSPFEDWILDVRVLPDPSRVVEVASELEFLPHRAVFLILGFSIMLMAGSLSESVIFYYSSAMTIGIIHLILMVLYQFGILFLVCLVLAGAWFGYWGVCKLVLTDKGLVDTDVTYFVRWAVLIFGGIVILQSSLDASLAAQALIISIITSAVSRTNRKLKFLRRLFRMIVKCIYTILSTIQLPKPIIFRRHYQEFNPNAPNQSMNRRTAQNNSTTIGHPHPPESYYSTFHKTPERKIFGKEEWETFTKEETRKALMELVSSPDFCNWAAEHAERITLTPPADAGRIKRRRVVIIVSE